MNKLLMKRGKGKSTAVVYTSAATGYPIMTCSKCRAQQLLDMADGLGVKIPDPIFPLDDSTRGKRIDGVLVDDAEEILRQYVTEQTHAPLVAFTMTVDD